MESLAKDYSVVMASISRLAMRYNSLALEKMIYMAPVTEEMLNDVSKLEPWATELEQRLNSSAENSRDSYKVAIERSQNGNEMVRIIITEVRHGIANDTDVLKTFFASGEYQAMVKLGQQLEGLIGEGAQIRRGERTLEISSFKQALNWLMDEAKRGQQIQRYKGLGEMNPEQLWETTLNPETRRLLQVQIEDAVASDQIFTTLMGDQVEPRRDFIEKNALSVANLDI